MVNNCLQTLWLHGVLENMRLPALLSVLALVLIHSMGTAGEKDASKPILPPSHWPSKVVLKEKANCKTILKNIKAELETLPPFGEPGGCGSAAPLWVTSIAGIGLSPPIITNCDMAEALYGWIGTSLAVGAADDLGKQLVRVNTASDYVCRRRNSLASGKISEHGKANALDIASLQFSDGSRMSIKGGWSGLKAKLGLSKNSVFLKRIRRDACIRFTTVLGPGSDKYHGDHFHVDLAQRNNGFRICQ
jgi:hypothetical protein